MKFGASKQLCSLVNVRATVCILLLKFSEFALRKLFLKVCKLLDFLRKLCKKRDYNFEAGV